MPFGHLTVLPKKVSDFHIQEAAFFLQSELAGPWIWVYTLP